MKGPDKANKRGSRVDEMRNLDKSATEEFGISDDLLMENAGQPLHFVILKEFSIKNRKFVGLCGGGNNGGDGLVVARKWLRYNCDILKMQRGPK